MSTFTPVSALIGGLLIGVAATLLLAVNGRIAGVSGISARLWGAPAGDRSWRWQFLLALIAGVGLTYYLWFGEAPVAREGFPPWLLAVSGLLVGYGTALANGCTSGHGVCGLGRRSLRSLVATLVFLATGIGSAVIMRQVFEVY